MSRAQQEKVGIGHGQRVQKFQKNEEAERPYRGSEAPAPGDLRQRQRRLTKTGAKSLQGWRPLFHLAFILLQNAAVNEKHAELRRSHPTTYCQQLSIRLR